MMRRSFTLMELLVATAIISIILIYLYQATNTMKISNDFYAKRSEKELLKEKLFFALYRDILQMERGSAQIKNEEKSFDTISVISKNSHYNMIYPYVGYYVSKDKTLLRLESLSNMNLPATLENLTSFKSEVVAENIELFRIYKKEKYFLVHVKMQEGNELIFQVVV